MGHKRLTNDTCPTCDAPLKVEQNGAEFLARCAGQPGDYLGCHAEFGDTPQAAVDAVQELVL